MAQPIYIRKLAQAAAHVARGDHPELEWEEQPDGSQTLQLEVTAPGPTGHPAVTATLSLMVVPGVEPEEMTLPLLRIWRGIDE